MATPPNNASKSGASFFSIPSLEELERAQAEEDEVEPTIFFEPKRLKLNETFDANTEAETDQVPSLLTPSLNRTSSNPEASSATSAGPSSSSSFKSSATGNRFISSTEKPLYQPGQSATGSAVDSNLLLIHERQRGNPLLNYLRHVKWQHTPDIVPDFQFGVNQCGLFVSMKYHQGNSFYIQNRINNLPGHYVVRVLLVLDDLEDHEQVLLSLNTLCVQRDMTLILAFSNLEAARYLETYKSLENTSPDTIKETAGKGDHTDQVRVALSSVKSINSTDVVNLLHTFGSVAKIFTASLEQLATVPGLGEKKIAALFNAFHQPFVTSAALIPSTQMLKTHQPAISSFFKHRGNLSPSQS